MDSKQPFSAIPHDESLLDLPGVNVYDASALEKGMLFLVTGSFLSMIFRPTFRLRCCDTVTLLLCQSVSSSVKIFFKNGRC